ncbi:MAG: P-II family nitrogen regulator [Clostridia bacterium]|nr:P-II family nitrogen regulator [Clostridia bacterium]
MNKLSMFTLIVPREAGDTWQGFLRGLGLSTMYSFPCQGTAGKGLLERLGLSSSEKTLLCAATPRRQIPRILRRCVSDMGLNMPGTGVALSVPFESAGGRSSLNTLLGGQAFDPEEVSEMAPTEYPYSLIVAIVMHDQSDSVMDAARSAGAQGGTIVHAKGTAGETAQNFLGLALAAEKEMVLILAAQQTRRDIMRAIMDKAGAQSDAHTVLFSLPVEDIAGLRSIMPDEDEN